MRISNFFKQYGYVNKIGYDNILDFIVDLIDKISLTQFYNKKKRLIITIYVIVK